MCLLFSTAHILEMIFLEVVGLATFTWDTQRNPKENRDDHLIALMSMVGREKQGQGQSGDFFFLDMVLFSNMYGKPYCWCMLADTRVLVMCHHASPRIRCWGFPLHLHWKEDDILSMFYNQVVTQNHAIITSFQDVPADKREKLFYLKKKKRMVFHTITVCMCFTQWTVCIALRDWFFSPFSQSGRNSKQGKLLCWRRGYFDLCHLQSVQTSSHTLSSHTEITMSTQGFVRA